MKEALEGLGRRFEQHADGAASLRNSEWEDYA
jgi:hypothetical protein